MPSDDHEIAIKFDHALTVGEILIAIVDKNVKTLFLTVISSPQSYSISIATILTQRCILISRINLFPNAIANFGATIIIINKSRVLLTSFLQLQLQ